MLKTLAKLLRVLNSETEPGQISLGLCFALVAGLTPLWSLHNIVVLFCVLVLRVNLSAFLVSLPVFSAFAYLLDPLFHAIGLPLLTSGSLEPLWTSLYNSTLWRLERFNNSIVMGIPGKVVRTQNNWIANRFNAHLYEVNAQAYARGQHRAWDDAAVLSASQEKMDELRAEFETLFGAQGSG